MRELELNVLDDASIRELAAGHRLKLVFDNVTVAEVSKDMQAGRKISGLKIVNPFQLRLGAFDDLLR